MVVDLLQVQYKYKKAMHKSTELRRQSKETQFVKGMTLNQYLTSYTEYTIQETEENDQKQENLFQSSHYSRRKGFPNKSRESRIEEIDQESIQDSVQYNKQSRKKATPIFKELDFDINQASEENLLPQKNLRSKINSISSNVRQNLKVNSQQKNSFRVKKMSMSPGRRKNEEVLINGSITLYGSKFGQVTKRQETKMPELLTFYGKLSLGKQEVKLKQKTSLKGGQMKQGFKKKNQLQLKDLLLLQSRIKSNYSLSTTNREMMITGIKDKLKDRK